MRPVSSSATLEHATAAAEKVVEVHRRLVDFLAVGQTLAQIDTFVGETLRALGAKSCFQGYKVPRTPAFPSFSCLSPNDCVVHGTAGFYTKPMAPGDVLSIDIGVKYRGWIGDAAWTYVFKETDDLRQRLMESGKVSIKRGIERLQPGGMYIDFARAVQHCVEDQYGFHCIRGLGGHGYGRTLHEPPFVSNAVPEYPGEWPDATTVITPGTLIAIEPMVAVGTKNISQKRGEWPVFTADGSLSVHYEHDVYIAEDGPIVLTQGLEELPDVVG
jgi:methionyl aminopeptidase